MKDLERLRLEHLRAQLDARGVLWVSFARPEVRNAMALQTVDELESVLDGVASRRDVRVLVLRGEGGHFCAGGDIKDMAAARSAPSVGDVDPLAVVNRRYGALLERFASVPQATVAVLEGSVMGGGLGLACVVDVAIARADARFGLPETSLGIVPAQLLPFLVQRLGRSHAGLLAVTGGRFDGHRAAELGLVHRLADDDESLLTSLDATLTEVLRCAPGALAETKAILAMHGTSPMAELLDHASGVFAQAARGAEGMAGMTAFLQKRPPPWVPPEDVSSDSTEERSQ